MLKIMIPADPVGKGRPRASTIGGKARLYTPKKTAEYEKAVKIKTHVAMAGRAPSAAPIEAEIWVMMRIPESWSMRKKDAAVNGDALPCTKPDLDNVAKIVLDAMNGIAYHVDRQITDLVIRRRYGVGEPCVLVYLTERTESKGGE